MLTTANADKNVEHWLVEMQNGTTTMEDSLTISYETKHTLNIW